MRCFAQLIDLIPRLVRELRSPDVHVLLIELTLVTSLFVCNAVIACTMLRRGYYKILTVQLNETQTSVRTIVSRRIYIITCCLLNTE